MSYIAAVSAASVGLALLGGWANLLLGRVAVDGPSNVRQQALLFKDAGRQITLKARPARSLSAKGRASSATTHWPCFFKNAAGRTANAAAAIGTRGVVHPISEDARAFYRELASLTVPAIET